ncbi:MAG: type II methionyl aminopeptidase [Promethearchaeota archaeon]
MPPLDPEIYDKYLKAGQAVAHALKLAYKLARPGTNLYDLATILENDIIEHGGDGWSFPANISLDVEAAHYSPIIDDSKVLPKEGLLKVDLGGHVDGYVSDAAITVNLGNSEIYDKLIKAVKDALYAAIPLFIPGVPLRDIGVAIEREITKYQGIKPVSNLGGHQLKQWNLHAGAFVPNVANSNEDYVLKEGDQFACEPFATNGYGAVKNGPEMTIFRVRSIKKKKNLPMTEKIRLQNFKKKFNTFPFSPRWIDFIPKNQINGAISKYNRQGILEGYHVFLERGNGIVSQHEHTIIVSKDGGIPTTWWEDFDYRDLWK